MTAARVLAAAAALALAGLLGAGCSTPAPVEPQAPASVAPPEPAREPAPPPSPEPPPPPPARSKGEQELDRAIESYEEGDYRGATRQFHAALESGLATPADRASAHKYLAFVACAERQERLCRDEFRKAFAADPRFDLTPAEAGHPGWGRVFRSVKAEYAAKTRAK